MKPDDRVRIRHIVDALHSTIRFTGDRHREDLDKDEMLAFALVHALQIVGEAASKISVETREKYSQIPWATIVGMRHRWFMPISISTLTLSGQRRRKPLLRCLRKWNPCSIWIEPCHPRRPQPEEGACPGICHDVVFRSARLEGERGPVAGLMVRDVAQPASVRKLFPRRGRGMPRPLMVIEMKSPALVLTTVNAPHSKQLGAQELACCLLNSAAAQAVPGDMSAFFGEVSPELQCAFAEMFGVSHAQLVEAAKVFASVSGESYPLAA